MRVTFVEVDFITILTETNECQSNPCQNGGTCVDDVYKFTCLCPNAYAGTFCQGKTKCNSLLSLKTITFHWCILMTLLELVEIRL